MKKKIDSLFFSIKQLAAFNPIYWNYLLRNWWKSFFNILTLIATIVTILSLLGKIEVQFSISFFLINLFFITFISFSISLPSNYKLFQFNGLYGTNIELIIGDMFNEKCDLVIPTNTCFDVDRESIKPQSIQGKFCIKFYNNDTGLLNKDVEDLLSKLDCSKKYLENKTIGKHTQYPINTIITLSWERFADAQNFHWIAINHSADNGGVIKESANIRNSIDYLWKYLGNHRKIRDLCLPMLGAGFAGQNEPLPDIVEYYIDSFLISSRKSNIVKTLKIYLYPDKGNVFENYQHIANYLQYRSKTELMADKKYPICNDKKDTQNASR